MQRSGAALTAIFGLVLSSAAAAQDFNYVPGWANTMNHRYQGGSGKVWEEKASFFAALGGLDPDVACTLRNIGEQDGNVIYNSYRRERRNRGDDAALRGAMHRIAPHYQALRKKGRC